MATLADMPPELKFAGLMASLRAPRLAILIPRDHWAFFARRAIEFLSQTWGGAGGVVVPMTESGDVDAAVYRLLQRYDPDYTATLSLSLADVETLRPGWLPLTENGVAVPDADRWQFIHRAEESGPQFVSYAVEDEAVATLAHKLNCFEESGRAPRLHRVHPGRPAYTPLAPVQPEPDRQVNLESGDELIDLAVGMKAGLSHRPTSARSIRQRSLTRYQIASFLTGDDTYAPPSPMEDTRAGLTWIRSGFMADRRPLVVLGSDASDMALAMLWDRMTGRGIWLPVGHRHTTWHSAIGSSLDLARLRGDAAILLTSTSLTEDQCLSRIRRLWGARELIDPSSSSEPWDYVPPTELDLQGRLDLRVDDRWDERFAAPMLVGDDGSFSMATTFPLVAPVRSDGLASWIVEVQWPEQPLHVHPAISGSDLVAADQSRDETHVRASGIGIAFESGRWDFVQAGASPYGQLAQPKLRWPGLLNTLKTAASASGYDVRPSHAGKVGRTAAGLWRGRNALAEDLHGEKRALLEAFISNKRQNGPIDLAPDLHNDDRRILVHGACLVPFGALPRIAPSVGISEIRAWLDLLSQTGAVRMGLVLECGTCPWRDFYTVDDFGARFKCKRCGATHAITHERWLDHEVTPRWYYSLHPTIREFLDQNGDVPVLAARQFGATTNVEFELELVRSGETRPTAEIDFALVSRNGLVIGEAKRVGTLDGKTEKDRVRDATKLVKTAQTLGAREVCFASAGTWGLAARAAIDQAVVNTASGVTVTILERLATSSPPSRKVIHNPGGP